MKEIIAANFIKVDQSVIALARDKEKLPPLNEEITYSREELHPYETLAMRFRRAMEIICNIFFRAVEMAEYGNLSEDTPSCFARMEELSIISSADLWLTMMTSFPAPGSSPDHTQRIHLWNEILTRSIDELNDFHTRVKKKYPAE
jgi:hypothetical protein